MVVHLLLCRLRISRVSTELRISRSADSCNEERFVEGSFEYYQQGACYSFWWSRWFKEGKPAFEFRFAAPSSTSTSSSQSLGGAMGVWDNKTYASFVLCTNM